MNNLDYNYIKDCTIWSHILRFGSSAIFNYFQTNVEILPSTSMFGSIAIFNYFQTIVLFISMYVRSLGVVLSSIQLNFHEKASITIDAFFHAFFKKMI